MVKKRHGEAVIITPGPVGGCGYCTTEVLALVAPSSAGAPRAGLVSGASAEPVEKLIAGWIDTKLDWRHGVVLSGKMALWKIGFGQHSLTWFLENWLGMSSLDGHETQI